MSDNADCIIQSTPVRNEPMKSCHDGLRIGSDRRSALRVLAAAASSMVAVPQTAKAQSPRVDHEILIGQSCQLSGPLASLSQEIQEGASWYFERVNAQGGVRGRRIRVIALDDGYDPKRASENVRQLVDQSNVLALFNVAGSLSNVAALPIVRERKVPLVAPFTGSELLRNNQDRYVFNVRASYADEIRKIVEHLSTIGMNRVGVVYMNNTFGKGGLDAVKAHAKMYKVDLLTTVSLEADGKGLQEASLAMAKTGPVAVILVLAGKLTGDFILACKKLDLATQFYAMSVVSSEQLVAALGERSSGIAIAQVMPYPSAGASSLSRELMEVTKQKGVSNPTYIQMEGYVSAKVLVEGLRRVGPSLTREGLTRALESLTSFDLGGFRVSFSARNHNGSTFVELSMIDKTKRLIH